MDEFALYTPESRGVNKISVSQCKVCGYSEVFFKNRKKVL